MSAPAGERAPRVVLVSTYDLGRQPFGLASPAAWLERLGAVVTCNDLAVEPLDQRAVRDAEFVAFHLPMHTATRLAARVAREVRALNPGARLGFFGLYAPMNEAHLRGLGADLVIGGEFERALADWVSGGAPPGGTVSLERLPFVVPDRRGLPDLSRYARLIRDGEEHAVGYTEASRGCKHLCRHCPVVPVYRGHFRIVPRDVVLADIRQQVEAGARHITFGDPDFWNGIGHAQPIVRALHDEFPALTYDVTIKIEHLLRHGEHLGTLRDTGCLFVTSAVESVDDRVLRILEKAHTRADFVEVLRRFRAVGLALHPTFVAFTPWITADGYLALLQSIRDLDLIESVAPVQLAIRLLIPAGSRLLELPDVRSLVGPFDEARLCHPWEHPDPRVDSLQREIETMVRDATARGESRSQIFDRAWECAEGAAEERVHAPALEYAGVAAHAAVAARDALAQRAGFLHTAREPKRAPIPFLTEPWYC
ncbi:MAG TPA: CUAEP/CCAEP-tail radical SAM protein [Candidatus Eisenbacteria bacterium]|jgi:radical SAM superfamily enzyme YgiQ (UPF0313 family)